ncbi:hypothetical protein [Emticicia sp. 21SJ11W-3]|uniref:hypothetical protein n=1 Tax=Emticicia sp. 21SJ11W-3 TaxID=2916755 RepID=UPI00209E49A8|nr:hypothetical protein [Emticicia sp. 21SJ11W-3]UTA67546.1 hypothetical protein MB380_18385 [Emticicia sp. 21SJ11W-3]
MDNSFDKYFGRIGGIVTIISTIITPQLSIRHQLWLWGFLISIFLLWLSNFLGRKATTKRIENSVAKQPFSEALIDFFEQKKLEGKDAEIIRWGLSLSTPLWLSQKYEIRKKIGEYIEIAAINRDNYRALIKVLVDDIGWTSVEMLQYSFAETKLNQGVFEATKHSDYAFLAKAYRHLNASSIRQNLISKAENYLQLSLDATNRLDGGIEKDELIAEYYFAKATIELKKGINEAALTSIEQAVNLYEKIKDKEWPLKILARKGEILINLNRVDEAKKIFLKGIKISTDLQYNRQKVKNEIGLGLCYSTIGHNKTALEHLTNAELLADSIGMYYELELIKREKIKLNNRI